MIIFFNKIFTIRNLLIGLFIILLSSYSLYAHFNYLGFEYFARGNQYLRHEALLNGNSEAFNPWQYRILQAYLVEGVVKFCKLIELQEPYFVAFFSFRFFEHIAIFIAAILFYGHFTKSVYLVLFALIIMSYSMSLSIWDSDLSFNTYLDVLFYLIAANIIFANLNKWLFVPLSVLAALNRETGMLIPVLLSISSIDFIKVKIISKKDLYISLLSLMIFILIFFLLRFYYGFRENEVADGLKWIKFNLTDEFTYFNLFGTISILPLIILSGLNKIDFRLKMIFLFISPLWFLVHYLMVPVAESRIFLVPMVLIFIPCVLDLINKSIVKPDHNAF